MGFYIDKQLFSTIKEGEIHELGHLLYQGIPNSPFHPPFVYSMAAMHNDLIFKNGISQANDYFAGGTHSGTHIDAIGHISCGGQIHGGLDINSIQSKEEGLKNHSIADLPPIIKRGVLLDIPTFFEIDVLDHAYEITADNLKGAVQKQGTEIKKGDVVLIRTGWANYYNDSRKFLSSDKGVPGVIEPAAKWLTSMGISITGSDTSGYEKTPTHSLPVHRYLLVEKGIPILESLNLESLAERKVYEFVFIALPLGIKGGTGSPIRPIAIA